MKSTHSYWPLGIVTVFIVFGAGLATMIVLACRSNNDLVTPDYYEQELHYQNRKESAERAQRLPEPARVIYDTARYHIQITLPMAHARPETHGTVELYRPSAARLDQQFPLQLDAHGAQNLDAGRLAPGLWKVKVSWSFGGEEFRLDKEIIVPRESAAWGSPNAGWSSISSWFRLESGELSPNPHTQCNREIRPTGPCPAKSGGKRAALQTLRETCEPSTLARAFGVRWLQHRFRSLVPERVSPGRVVRDEALHCSRRGYEADIIAFSQGPPPHFGGYERDAVVN